MTALEREAGSKWTAAMLVYGAFLFRYRNAIFPAVWILLLLGFRPAPFMGDRAIDAGTDLLGLLIGLAGIGLRAVVVGLAYIKRGGVNRTIFAKDLVTEGMFAHCRNPLYVGNMLAILGLFVIYNSPWVYALGGLFYLTAYAAIVATEERYLSAKFGAAYADYCRRVPRWRIEWRGIRATLDQFQFNWRRVITKEYSSIGTWVVMYLAVFAASDYANSGLAGSPAGLVAAGIGAVVTGILVLAVRGLKKAGKLSSV